MQKKRICYNLSMMITIHKVQIEEIPTVKELLSYTWIDTYGHLLSHQAIAKVTAVWHSPENLKAQALDPETYFAVAKDDLGNIVGLVTARKIDPETNYLSRLYVHPSCQRLGIGKRLLEAATTAFPHAKKMQLEVEEENKKGLSFYLKHGFKRLETKSEVVEGVSLHSVVMEKSTLNESSSQVV
jgi:ribosomal protein S18 acetylase RimI-like enzyme